MVNNPIMFKVLLYYVLINPFEMLFQKVCTKYFQKSVMLSLVTMLRLYSISTNTDVLLNETDKMGMRKSKNVNILTPFDE